MAALNPVCNRPCVSPPRCWLRALWTMNCWAVEIFLTSLYWYFCLVFHILRYFTPSSHSGTDSCSTFYLHFEAPVSPAYKIHKHTGFFSLRELDGCQEIWKWYIRCVLSVSAIADGKDRVSSALFYWVTRLRMLMSGGESWIYRKVESCMSLVIASW